MIFSFRKQLLTLAVDDELGCLSIRLESELFSDVTKFQIRLESAVLLAHPARGMGEIL